MNINEILKLEIIDDNHLGNGIAKIKDTPVFVKGALKGDVVKVRITGIYKKHLAGEIKSFIKKEKREELLCPYYDKCGGCNLLHISYDKELDLKKKYIEKLFKKDVNVISFERNSYRNKINLHVKDNTLGLYKEDTNEVVEIDKCLLVSDSINEFISYLKNIDLSKIKEITIKEGNGLLLSISGHISNSDIKDLINYPNLKSIYENDKLIYGDEYLETDFNDFKFYVNNNSFLQVNTACAISLYDKVKEYVGTCINLLDLYCGSATIGIYLNDICKNITGVEINKDSVRCGKKNIKENNISNYNLILEDAKDIEGSFDTIIVDPPRTGLSKGVIEYLNNSSANTLIYVSCNPSTLKRDIDLLNYELKEITAFNMFPVTGHIETVVILERKDV